ncbi:MAG: hypothetical protein WC490_01710 [Candidatus Margulisiibacteriota bacterium]
MVDMGKKITGQTPQFLSHTAWLTSGPFSVRLGRQVSRLMCSDRELQGMLAPKVNGDARLSLFHDVRTRVREIYGGIWTGAVNAYDTFKTANPELFAQLVDKGYVDRAGNMLQGLGSVRKAADIRINAGTSEKSHIFDLLRICFLPFQMAVEHGLDTLPCPGYLMGLAQEWPVTDDEMLGMALRHEAGHIAAGFISEEDIIGLNGRFSRGPFEREVLATLINAFEDNKVVRFQLMNGFRGSAEGYVEISIGIFRRRLQVMQARDKWMIPFHYLSHVFMVPLAFEMVQDPGAADISKRVDNLYKKYVDDKSRALIKRLEEAAGLIIEGPEWTRPEVFSSIFDPVALWAKTL